MKPFQNSFIKADASIRPIAESGIWNWFMDPERSENQAYHSVHLVSTQLVGATSDGGSSRENYGSQQVHEPGIGMKPSQNSWFKANTSVRSVAERGILGLVHDGP
jgi:hypothetical protein